jgi:NitT/TauT family transport system ATP-binding protein
MSTIEFSQIGRAFQRNGQTIPIIEGFELTVGDKEFVAVVGPSGCGKTTCMRMAAGLDFPTSGRLLVSDKPVTQPGPDRAVVFQQFALFPWKSVYDNIDFGLRAKKLPQAQRAEIINRYIGLMNLKGYESAYPHQLSGGMQQRVAIARAYALDPDVLLMDEPFGALDAQTRVVMQEELVKLARKHPRTVLFITHAVEEAVYLADRVVIMAARPGRVKEILDIKTVREAQNWDQHSRIEDVMDLDSFVHLRTRIWKSLREEHAGTDH